MEDRQSTVMCDPSSPTTLATTASASIYKSPLIDIDTVSSVSDAEPEIDSVASAETPATRSNSPPDINNATSVTATNPAIPLVTKSPTEVFASAWAAHELEQLHVHDDGLPDFLRSSAAQWKKEFLSLFAPFAIHAHRRKVILLGPHDRFNFGDLLFEKVTHYLLRNVAKYSTKDVIVAGMLNRTDMAASHDGPKVIVSIQSAVKESQRATMKDSTKGPYHIVYLGGQCATTNWNDGLIMFPDELKPQVAQNQLVDCAYMVPKELLLPAIYRNASNETMYAHDIQQPVAIVNSINYGKNGDTPCGDAVRQADYAAFRDITPTHKELKKQARPDSAVLTNFLFHETIAKAGATGEVLQIRSNFSQGYLAVQMKVETINKLGVDNIAATLDELYYQTQLPAVFFRAGSVPMHDSLETIKAIRSRMTTPSATFYSERLWQVIALIRYSDAVLSTSLHVRIMSFVHARPRVTFCGSKHRAFSILWDAKDATPCVEDLESVVPSMLQSMATPKTKTYEAQRKAIQSYMEGFRIYSGLLNK
ncbi:hypothetical protein MPSEU_000845100 [Mayamaea pseudoterrestris]|nr:hypothetical protein MPSEU_000845100 [Mayamaea pseudoterrestris]